MTCERGMNGSERRTGLCLTCGLCCDGTLFGSVELQPGDDPAHLQALGLRILRGRAKATQTSLATTKPPSAKLKFLQPCVALEASGRCAIYHERPTYCRGFDCALLKAVAADRLTTPAARRKIKNALKQVALVRRLLRRLGQTDEGRDLRSRVRRLGITLQHRTLSEAEAALYGRLTLAIHSLDRRLRRDFLPDPSASHSD